MATLEGFYVNNVQNVGLSKCEASHKLIYECGGILTLLIQELNRTLCTQVNEVKNYYADRALVSNSVQPPSSRLANYLLQHITVYRCPIKNFSLSNFQNELIKRAAIFKKTNRYLQTLHLCIFFKDLYNEATLGAVFFFTYTVYELPSNPQFMISMTFLIYQGTQGKAYKIHNTSQQYC